MQARHLIGLIVSISMLFVFGTVALAQTYTPDVQVDDTGIVDDTVTIAQATVAGPGWVVIHADAGGKPGPVIGSAPLTEGVNTNIAVDIEAGAATPILHAMLHVDDGAVGTFEFPGPDGPVKIGDAIVMARFSATPVVSDEEEMAAPTTVPATGAGTSSPLIFAVTAMFLFVLVSGVVVSRRHA
jgi:hypothetical protein